ncbi:helix-turn-helix domain-containing protein [Waltera sp.]
MRSVSAFANTRGGRLLIGVRDDGHISGVKSEEEIFMNGT